ncbi:hypothetical protein T4A_8105 [Trichinella pseudospiralis]|uniref:Uncharacterized protein n=1 Tax=Trichinella pseudospiralis TaxID=6337 RepID=A0A0V1DR52_TRIPS|nr:hypothetical protein T4A_8105 [Trichinella pseudospiralis]
MKKAECTKNRFLTLHYANNDRHKGKVNEAKKGESANDTKQIMDDT